MASMAVLFTTLVPLPSCLSFHHLPSYVSDSGGSNHSRKRLPSRFAFSGGFTFSPAVAGYQILTMLHVLREPPFSSFDYTALHIKGAQLLDVK